jgi:hypothetical protein
MPTVNNAISLLDDAIERQYQLSRIDFSRHAIFA